MVEVARRHKSVVQVGTQQRSGRHYGRARQLIRDTRTTTRHVCTRPWTTGRQRRCTREGDPEDGRRGEGGRAEGQRRGRPEFSRTVAKEGTFWV
jgi:hypothetical protein